MVSPPDKLRRRLENQVSSPSPLNGKTVLITGASRGIGAATAVACAKAGAKSVVLLARTISGLEETDDKVKQAGGHAILMPVDLRKLNDLDALGPTLLQHTGGIDGVVLNAAMLGVLGPLAHSDPKIWTRLFEINVHANMRLIRTLDPLLRRSDAGRLVAVSSARAQNPQAYWSGYSASKAALESMIECYQAELDGTSASARIFRAPATQTGMLTEAYPGGYPGDMAKIEDVAADIATLLS